MVWLWDVYYEKDQQHCDPFPSLCYIRLSHTDPGVLVLNVENIAALLRIIVKQCNFIVRCLLWYVIKNYTYGNDTSSAARIAGNVSPFIKQYLTWDLFEAKFWSTRKLTIWFRPDSSTNETNRKITLKDKKILFRFFWTFFVFSCSAVFVRNAVTLW